MQEKFIMGKNERGEYVAMKENNNRRKQINLI